MDFFVDIIFFNYLNYFRVVRNIIGKWSVVILRLIFFSSGKYVGYWLGDNVVLWD